MNQSSYSYSSSKDVWSAVRSFWGGFVRRSRVVPMEEIRANEGSLNITLYVAGETQTQTDAATTALPDALKGWLKSSAEFRSSLQSLLAS